MLPGDAPTNKPHLVVYSNIHADYGGVEFVLLQLIQGLQECYRFTVLSPASKSFQHRLAQAGGAWQDTPIPAAFSPKAIRQLARQFKALHANLILTLDPRGCTVAAPAAKLARLPMLHQNHISPLDYHHKTAVKKVFFRLGEALLGWGCLDATVFVSQTMRRRYVHGGLTPPWRAYYIPNSVDTLHLAALRQRAKTLRQQLAIPEETFLWVNIGRMTPQKAQDVILQAAAQLPDHPQWQLMIIGGGDLEVSLHQQAEQLGLGEKVKFLGVLSSEQTLEILAASDGFLLPSRYENMPITLLEALTLHIPSIVTDVGDSWGMIGGGDLPAAGVCVPKDDPNQLAQQMGQLMTNPAFYQGLKAACPARAEVFTPQRTLAAMDALIRHCLRP